MRPKMTVVARDGDWTDRPSRGWYVCDEDWRNYLDKNGVIQNGVNGRPCFWATEAEAENARQAALFSVPDGYALVPLEPTPEMLDAAAHASMQHLLDCIADPEKAKEVGSEEMTRLTHASRYRSMIAAAPKVPK